MKPITISSTMLEALIQNMDEEQFNMVYNIVTGDKWRRDDLRAEGQELSQDEIEMVKNSASKVDVIRAVRERLNCSLSTAKMVVDRNWLNHSPLARIIE